MKRLEVSCAVRHIYVVSRLRVNGCDMFKAKQMIFIYDAFFLETIDCSVRLRYAGI
jgi:hypothetical protein